MNNEKGCYWTKQLLQISQLLNYKYILVIHVPIFGKNSWFLYFWSNFLQKTHRIRILVADSNANAIKCWY